MLIKKSRIVFVIAVSILPLAGCMTVDVKKSQACPMYGNIRLNKETLSKTEITVQRFDGIISKVQTQEATRAKQINDPDSLDRYLSQYRFICGEEPPPFYDQIAYVANIKYEQRIAIEKMEEEKRTTEEENLKKEVERRKLSAINSISKNGLNLETLEKEARKMLSLEGEACRFSKSGQTVKAGKKKTEAEQAWKRILDLFYNGKVVTATPECPFIKGTSSTGEINRVFGFECFDGLGFQFEGFDDESHRGSFFNFAWLHWPEAFRTRNNETEVFESGERFTGSIQVVSDLNANSLSKLLPKNWITLSQAYTEGEMMEATGARPATPSPYSVSSAESQAYTEREMMQECTFDGALLVTAKIKNLKVIPQSPNETGTTEEP